MDRENVHWLQTVLRSESPVSRRCGCTLRWCTRVVSWMVWIFKATNIKVNDIDYLKSKIFCSLHEILHFLQCRRKCLKIGSTHHPNPTSRTKTTSITTTTSCTTMISSTRSPKPFLPNPNCKVIWPRKGEQISYRPSQSNLLPLDHRLEIETTHRLKVSFLSEGREKDNFKWNLLKAFAIMRYIYESCKFILKAFEKENGKCRRKGFGENLKKIDGND